MTELAMAQGTWEDAERLVGTVIAELSGADAVNDAMIRHQLEALEWDSPVFVDDESARRNGFGRRVAPFSMYMTFGMPAYWGPGRPGLRRNALAPFPFGAVPCPGSAMLATETSVEFHTPMSPGDQLSSVWRLAAVTRKQLSIGDGAFLDFEITYRNQRGDLVAVEHTSAFRYDPAPRANS